MRLLMPVCPGWDGPLPDPHPPTPPTPSKKKKKKKTNKHAKQSNQRQNISGTFSPSRRGPPQLPPVLEGSPGRAWLRGAAMTLGNKPVTTVVAPSLKWLTESRLTSFLFIQSHVSKQMGQGTAIYIDIYMHIYPCSYIDIQYREIRRDLIFITVLNPMGNNVFWIDKPQ